MIAPASSLPVRATPADPGSLITYLARVCGRSRFVKASSETRARSKHVVEHRCTLGERCWRASTRMVLPASQLWCGATRLHLVVAESSRALLPRAREGLFPRSGPDPPTHRRPEPARLEQLLTAVGVVLEDVGRRGRPPPPPRRSPFPISSVSNSAVTGVDRHGAALPPGPASECGWRWERAATRGTRRVRLAIASSTFLLGRVPGTTPPVHFVKGIECLIGPCRSSILKGWPHGRPSGCRLDRLVQPGREDLGAADRV